MKKSNQNLLMIGGLLVAGYLLVDAAKREKLAKLEAEANAANNEGADQYNNVVVMPPDMPSGINWIKNQYAAGNYRNAVNCPTEGTKCYIWHNDGSATVGYIDSNCECVPMIVRGATTKIIFG